MFLRHLICRAIALFVIASGRVRGARQQIHGRNLVTSIYFHNPNKRLFGKCIQWLDKNGYTFVSAKDISDFLSGKHTPPQSAVWLSIDDGFNDTVDTVIPIIREKHIPLTIFIPSGIVEGNGLFPWMRARRLERTGRSGGVMEEVRDSLTVQQLKTLASFPEVTIGSHTVNHAITRGLPDAAARFELEESKRMIEEWIGAPVTCFAYPEGRLDGREGKLLAELGYDFAATTEPAFFDPRGDPYLVPRFNVGDDIPFPEAICNMVGVWRPVINSLLSLLGRPGLMPKESPGRRAINIERSL